MSSVAPTVEVQYDGRSNDVLLARFAEYGLAGLTAVDYLVDQFDLEASGHVQVDGVPSITPFEDGTPRHHSRLFDGPDTRLTILVGELLVPNWVADEYAGAIFEWIERAGFEEVCLCSGVPIAHGPDDHRPFYIATEEFQRRRLDGTDLTAMNKGYLDGMNGSVMARGMRTDVATGLFTTPAHPQAPDVGAALRLLDAVVRVYDLDLDTEPLETFAREVEQYYSELAQRVEQAGEEQVPEDRMYM